MPTRSFKYACLPCGLVILNLLLMFIQCGFVAESTAQTTVRAVNRSRQTPSFLKRPFALLAGNGSGASSSDDGTSESVDDAFFAEYESQLNVILKTRLDEEKEFVNQIVQQIQSGNLSTRLVNTSFKWVRNKRPNVKNSFVYFERVLRLLAKSQGVDQFIPAFDASVYSQTSRVARRK